MAAPTAVHQPPTCAGSTSALPGTTRSAFLAANTTLTGFGSAADALLQAVREMTENALDSGASSVSVRVDPAAPPPAASPPASQPPGKPAAKRARAAAAAPARAVAAAAPWLVTVEDDGRGIPAASLPTLLGGVFASSKAGAATAGASSCAFGRYGVGLKAAILFAQQASAAAAGHATSGGSLAPPLYVATTCAGEQHIRCCRVGIDVDTDAPVVAPEAALEKATPATSGTLVSLELLGDAAGASGALLAYFERLRAYPARAAVTATLALGAHQLPPARRWGAGRGASAQSRLLESGASPSLEQAPECVIAAPSLGDVRDALAQALLGGGSHSGGARGGDGASAAPPELAAPSSGGGGDGGRGARGDAAWATSALDTEARLAHGGGSGEGDDGEGALSTPTGRSSPPAAADWPPNADWPLENGCDGAQAPATTPSLDTATAAVAAAGALPLPRVGTGRPLPQSLGTAVDDGEGFGVVGGDEASALAAYLASYYGVPVDCVAHGAADVQLVAEPPPSRVEAGGGGDAAQPNTAAGAPRATVSVAVYAIMTPALPPQRFINLGVSRGVAAGAGHQAAAARAPARASGALTPDDRDDGLDGDINDGLDDDQNDGLDDGDDEVIERAAGGNERGAAGDGERAFSLPASFLQRNDDEPSLPAAPLKALRVSASGGALPVDETPAASSLADGDEVLAPGAGVAAYLSAAQRRNVVEAPVHVLRYAGGVPLLAGAAVCDITAGIVRAFPWHEFGLSLMPLAERAGVLLANSGAGVAAATAAAAAATGGGAAARASKRRKSTAAAWGAPLEEGPSGAGAAVAARLTRRWADRLNEHPATASAFDLTAVDADAAFVAHSCVPDAPVVPFAALRLVVDVRVGGAGAAAAAASLPFGSMAKRHLAGGPAISHAVARAGVEALCALRDGLPGALLSAADVQRGLLHRVYLPSIARELAAIVRHAALQAAWLDPAAAAAAGAAGAPALGSSDAARCGAFVEAALGALPELDPAHDAGIPADASDEEVHAARLAALEGALAARLTRLLEANLAAMQLATQGGAAAGGGGGGSQVDAAPEGRQSGARLPRSADAAEAEADEAAAAHRPDSLSNDDDGQPWWDEGGGATAGGGSQGDDESGRDAAAASAGSSQQQQLEDDAAGSARYSNTEDAFADAEAELLAQSQRLLLERARQRARADRERERERRGAAALAEAAAGSGQGRRRVPEGAAAAAAASSAVALPYYH